MNHRKNMARVDSLGDYQAEHFLWSVTDRVATITLNRPERKNPLTFESYAGGLERREDSGHHGRG
jgi:1,4-dihydroxy-2-naphthoyl-CoA synthase